MLRGSTYEQAVRRHLGEPLGIEELACDADQALAFRTAIGHVRADPAAALRPSHRWAVMPPPNPAAGNQLAMSARGLLAVARMHLADGHAPDGSLVVSPASARLMRERQVDHPGAAAAADRPSGHGLGWWLEDGGVVEHGGGSLGVASLLRFSPRLGIAAVVLTNAEGGSALAAELLEPWFDDPSGATRSAPVVPSATAPRLDPSSYLGHYEDRQHRMEVRQVAGRLLLSNAP